MTYTGLFENMCYRLACYECRYWHDAIMKSQPIRTTPPLCARHRCSLASFVRGGQLRLRLACDRRMVRILHCELALALQSHRNLTLRPCCGSRRRTHLRSWKAADPSISSARQLRQLRVARLIITRCSECRSQLC